MNENRRHLSGDAIDFAFAFLCLRASLIRCTDLRWGENSLQFLVGSLSRRSSLCCSLLALRCGAYLLHNFRLHTTMTTTMTTKTGKQEKIKVEENGCEDVTS